MSSIRQRRGSTQRRGSAGNQVKLKAVQALLKKSPADKAKSKENKKWCSIVPINVKTKQKVGHKLCPFCAEFPGVHQPPCPLDICRSKEEHRICEKCIIRLLEAEDPIQDQCSWCRQPTAQKEWEACLDSAKKSDLKPLIKQDATSREMRRARAQLKDSLKDIVEEEVEELAPALLATKADLSDPKAIEEATDEAVEIVEDHVRVMQDETVLSSDEAEMLLNDEGGSNITDSKEPEVPKKKPSFLVKLGRMILNGLRYVGNLISKLFDIIFRSKKFHNALEKLAVAIVNKAIARFIGL